VDDLLGKDYWAPRWADAYVQFAAGEKRWWLSGLGVIIDKEFILSGSEQNPELTRKDPVGVSGDADTQQHAAAGEGVHGQGPGLRDRQLFR
jgi:predicted oxidoreductase